MERSMFSKRSSQQYIPLSTSTHELPRWRTPSPMATSTIPPPIVQSTYAVDPRTLSRSIVVQESTPHSDKQKELESDLQFLLDAQADSLSGGIDSGYVDDRTSEGSTTPTALSVRSGSSRRIHKPTRRKPGIRSARKGIYNSIVALSAVKAEEIEDIDGEVRVKDQKLEKIGVWQQKKERLEAASKEVDSSEDTTRSQRLRHEADVLQQEINHVGLQLADMKGRQRKLLREAAAAENAVQAKLASYTSSLRLIEEDVQKFLTLNPAESSSARGPSREQLDSVWQLPVKRRTLELARQYWTDERHGVLQQRESAEQEKVALDEGAVFWRDVVVQLTDFERYLHTDMAERAAAARRSSSVAQGGSSLERTPRCSAEALDRLNNLVQGLESKLETASERRWNPLIAAIGAELDALKQARQLLGGTSPATSDRDQNSDQAGSDEPSPDEVVESAESPPATNRGMNNGSSPEDDPDPELLFSKHELDSE